MKLKRAVAATLIILLAVALAGCNSNKTGINILEQDSDYVGPFDMPASKKTEVGSALWALTQLNENGFKIKSASKTRSDDDTIEESYKINSYDVYIELFRYDPRSEKLNEIIDTGKYIIYGNGQNIVKEYNAYVNGNYVMFFSSDKDFEGNDATEKNKSAAALFTSLELSGNGPIQAQD